MSLDAMKQAYVALHNAYEGRLKTHEMLRAMTALRHAIYAVDTTSLTPIEDWPRQWQGLMEDEIVGLTCECVDDETFNMDCALDFARAIEAKLKEKNNE